MPVYPCKTYLTFQIARALGDSVPFHQARLILRAATGQLLSLSMHTSVDQATEAGIHSHPEQCGQRAASTPRSKAAKGSLGNGLIVCHETFPHALPLQLQVTYG